VPATIVIASLTSAPEAERLAALAGEAHVLEVRADLFSPPDVDWLRRHFPGRLLFTLRSVAEGGTDRRPAADRHALLTAAAADWDLVDLELRDVDAGTLDLVPAGKRVLSWHGAPESFEELQSVAARMLAFEAHWYKLVNWVDRSGPDRWPLVLLHGLGRDDVIAFGGGEIGSWTRVMAPVLGSPAIFVAAGPRPAAPGQFPIERLAIDFCWPLPTEVRALFGVVGRPVAHSLSPYLFNRALRRLDMPALYVPFHVEKFGEFWLEVVEEGGFVEAGCPLRGLSVTAPNKRIAMAVAGATSPLVDRICSANTMVFRDGVWEADSTDPEGVLGPLRRRKIVVRGRRAAVLGAGGAGRAAAWALKDAGAEVTLFNRDPERGALAARELGIACRPWNALDPAQFGVILQATSLGRSDDEPLPCDVSRLPADAVGFDLVYRRHEPTPWVAALRASGRVAIDGREALLHQALPQFAAMTDRSMPSDLVAEFLAEMEAV